MMTVDEGTGTAVADSRTQKAKVPNSKTTAWKGVVQELDPSVADAQKVDP